MHAAGERQDVFAAVADAGAEVFAAQLRKDDELAVEATSNTRLFYDGVVR